MQNAIARNVDVKAIGIAAPAAQLLDLVVGVTNNHCRCCGATAEAVPRELGNIEPSSHKEDLQPAEEAFASECRPVCGLKQRCTRGFGVHGEEVPEGGDSTCGGARCCC